MTDTFYLIETIDGEHPYTRAGDINWTVRGEEDTPENALALAVELYDKSERTAGAKIVKAQDKGEEAIRKVIYYKIKGLRGGRSTL